MLVKAEVVEGSDIMDIVGDMEYLIPAKTNGIEVDLKIKMPSKSIIGNNYPVKIRFTQILEENQGMVAVALAVSSSFDILIIEKPAGVEPEGMSRITIVLLIIGIIVVVVIIWVLIKKRFSGSVKPVKK